MADNNPNTKPLVPTLTGNPVIDSMIGAGLMAASTALATTSLTWMNSHGFHNVTQEQLFGVIFGGLCMGATVVWRYVQTKKTKTAIADHAITAAATGVIPAAVVKEAVKAPSIPETEITAALNNAEAIKNQGV